VNTCIRQATVSVDFMKTIDIIAISAMTAIVNNSTAGGPEAWCKVMHFSCLGILTFIYLLNKKLKKYNYKTKFHRILTVFF
jgi:hypothetical protein